MRILLVEDDPMIGKTLHAALQQDGYTVDWVKDGQAGQARARHRDGRVRARPARPRPAAQERPRPAEGNRAAPATRCACWSSRRATRSPTASAGLDAGADDYLVKPFSLDELAARMRALLRRDVAREDNVLRNGDLALDPADAHGDPRRRAGRPVARANSRCWPRCSSGRARRCPRRSSRSGSTAGARKWKATPSKCTSTTCARSSAPTRSARSAASAT